MFDIIIMKPNLSDDAMEWTALVAQALVAHTKASEILCLQNIKYR